MYFLLQFATFPILVGTMIVGGILPTMSWAALGGLMNDLFPDHFRYSALSISYAIAATVSGFVPLVTLALGEATGYAWWHPGIVLALLSAVTLVSAWAASRMPRCPRSAIPTPWRRPSPRPPRSAPPRRSPRASPGPARRFPAGWTVSGRLDRRTLRHL